MVLGLAGLGGVWLVSFAIVAVNIAVATAVTTAMAIAERRAAGRPWSRSRGPGDGRPAGWRSGNWRQLVWALAGVLAIGLAGPVCYGLSDEPTRDRPVTVALVQPGVVHNPTVRLAASERITAGLPAVDLVAWGES